MTNAQVGFIGVFVMLLLLLLRMPIAIALSLVSVCGIAYLRGSGASLGAMATLPFDFAANWTLSAVPMFLLMGAFAFNSGMTTSVFKMCQMWFWWVPGGLAIATNWASAAFGAVSGSSVAVTAIMARIAIPEMLKKGYDKSLASSVVAASGTIDAMIPPSIAFVIFAWYAEVSVKELFLAGVFPGILTGLVYTVLIVGRCMINPQLGPRGTVNFTPAERRHATIDAWPMPALFVGIFAGLYSGTMTPTESAASSAAIAFLIALVRRQMTWKVFKESVVESCLTTASVFFVIIGAAFFTRFMALSGLPRFISGAVAQISPSPFEFILVMSLILIVLGMFLESIGVMLLALPIIIPICRTLGIDLIWVGVIVVKLIMIGLLHPPLGMQAYVVKSVVGASIPLTSIFRGLLWFLAAEIFIMALIIAFPQISLWLPHTLLR